MCGITGIWDKKSSGVEVQKLKAITDSLKHRGPDDAGYLLFKEGKAVAYSDIETAPELNLPLVDSRNENFEIGLGHRRLSIIDLSSNSHQPMTSNACHIVFNGAIYNYAEIRHELEAKGYKFNSTGDTEVLLKAYLEWGKDCVKKLNGMWAFVIFDENKKKFFGARDITGVKPLYYSDNELNFSFASEAKSLKKHVSNEGVNHKMAVHFLLTGNQEEGAESMFSSICELKPAHAFEFDGKLKTWKYYEPELSRSKETVPNVEAQLETLLEQAIERHCIADVSIGSCLSGGIDSSAIMGLIAKNSPQLNAEAYSSVFPGMKIDESDFAKSVVEKWNIGWNKVTPKAEDFIQNLNLLHEIHDFPLISSSTFAQFEVMRIAKENKLKVILDGQGADELFGGYPQYTYAYLNEIRAKQPLLFFKLLKEHRIRFLDWLRNNIKRRILSSPSKYKKLLFQFYPELKLIRSDLLASYFEEISTQAEDFFFKDANAFLAEDFFGENLKNLLRYEDRNSMHFSIESRTPFADDKALMEFMFNLSAKQKLEEFPPKSLLRRAMKDILPSSVYERTDKKGFVSPHNQWVKENEAFFSAYFENNSELFKSNITKEELSPIFRSANRQEDYRSFRFLSLRVWEEVHFN